MKRLMIAALCALPLGCQTLPSSGIGLWELTKETSERYNEFQRWVEADLERENFPAGLCLASIVMDLTLSDVNNVNGEVGIPLAAPAQGLSLDIGFGGNETETNTDKISVPFVPQYKEIRKKEIYEADLKKFQDDWFKQNLREEVRDLPDVPPEPTYDGDGGRELFDKRRDLAAELWRIREALHYVVRASGRGTEHLLAPGKMVFTRQFQVVRVEEKEVSIAIAGRGTGELGSKNTFTEGNTMVITFLPNVSKDQMKCDLTSLPKPKEKKT